MGIFTTILDGVKAELHDYNTNPLFLRGFILFSIVHKNFTALNVERPSKKKTSSAQSAAHPWLRLPAKNSPFQAATWLTE